MESKPLCTNCLCMVLTYCSFSSTMTKKMRVTVMIARSFLQNKLMRLMPLYHQIPRSSSSPRKIFDEFVEVLTHKVDKVLTFCAPGINDFQHLCYNFYPKASPGTEVRFAKQVMQRKEECARSFATTEKQFISTGKQSTKQCLDFPEQFLEQ